MKKHLVAKSLIIFVIVGLITVGSVFAFFSLDQRNNGESFSLTTNTEGNTEIKNELELRKVADYSYFEAYTDTSIAAMRKKLIFVTDIVLTSDLIIDSDININLGGHTLNLNGHNLMIRHNFYGSLAITNGELLNTIDGVAATGGKFNLQTPNCKLELGTNLVYQIGLINIMEYDFDTTKDEVMEYFDLQFNHFAEENSIFRGYYIDNLPYITSYKGLPIKIEYRSSNEDVINNYGIVKRPIQDTEVELTVKLTDLVGDQTATKKYNITILKAGSNNLDIGLKIVDEYFSRYKITTEDGVFYFYSQAIALIKNLDYYGLSLEYSDTDDGNDLNNEDGILNILAANEDNTVTVNVKNTTTQETKSADYNFRSVNATNYEIANAFVNGMDALSIINTSTKIELKSNAPSYNIKKVIYSIVGDANIYYQIVKEINAGTNKEECFLIVKKLPTIYDRLYLKVEFEFYTRMPLTLEKEIGIIYTTSGGGGGSGEGDDFYNEIYTILSLYLAKTTQSGLSKGFSLSDSESGISIRYAIVGNEDGTNTYPFIHLDSAVPNKFVINQSKIPNVDTDITIKIFFGDNAVAYDRTLRFTLVGILTEIDDIEDTNLYNAILAIADINNDKILTRIEGETCKLPLNLNGIEGITSFVGLKYLLSVKEFMITNKPIFGLPLSKNFFENVIGENITRLVLNNCAIDNLSNFANMTNLNYLDLSNTNGVLTNKNSFNNVENLPLYPNLTTLLLNGLTLETLDGVEKQINLVNLYLQDDDIVLYRPLLNLENLENMYLKDYNGISEYNITSYVLLYKKNAKVNYYIDEVWTAVAAPTAEQILGTEILESIIYFNSGKILTLPTKMGTYDISWYANGKTTPLNGTTNNGVMTIEASTEGMIVGANKVEAWVTLSGITIKRLFIITIEA